MGIIQKSNKSKNIDILSITKKLPRRILERNGKRKGNVIVVMTAKTRDKRLLPHIKRVKVIAAIPAGADAKINRAIATSDENWTIPKKRTIGRIILMTPYHHKNHFCSFKRIGSLV